MDREHIKGAGDKATGAMKNVAGKRTGDKKPQADGKYNKTQDDIHHVVGHLKDGTRKEIKEAVKAPDTSPSDVDIAGDD